MKIEDVGDTEFLVDEQVDKFRFLEENERVIASGGRPAQGRPLLLGITKASLSTDEELDLERDMEYFVEPDEALAPRTEDLGE